MNKQHVNIIILCIGCIGFGAIFFLFFHNIISIHIRTKPTQHITQARVQESVTIFYYITAWHQEQCSLVMLPNRQDQLSELLKIFASIVSEEVTHKQFTVESCALTRQHDELIISFDRSPFPKQWSLRKKITLLESLFKTITTYAPEVTALRLMVQNKPLNDHQINTLRPLHKNLFDQASPKNLPLQTPINTILIEPALFKNDHGRTIDETSERVVNIQAAFQLKALLEAQFPESAIYVIRTEGLSFHDRLSSINGKNPDLVIRLGAYKTNSETNCIDGYYFSQNPLTEQQLPNGQDFLPCNQAYKLHLNTTTSLLTHLTRVLQKTPKIICFTTAFPLSSLEGISAPAWYVELGISPHQDPKTTITILSQALTQARVNSCNA